MQSESTRSGEWDGRKMMKIYSDFPVLKDLLQLKEDSRLTSGMMDWIQILEQELHLLVIYRFCLRNLELVRNWDYDEFFHVDEVSRVTATLGKKGLLETGVLAVESGEFEDWDTITFGLLEEIQRSKPSIRDDCLLFSNGCHLSVDELQESLKYIVVSLSNNIHLLKGEILIPEEKMEVESQIQKVDLFRKIFKFYVKHGESDDKIQDSQTRALGAWASNLANFCLVNWIVGEMHEDQYKNLIFYRLQQNFLDLYPNVVKICFSFLKAIKPPANDRFKVGELVSRFVKLLLRNLGEYLSTDAIQMLGNEMIFLITFVMAEANDGQSISAQVSAFLDDAAALIISLYTSERNEASIGEVIDFLLHDFLEKVNAIKTDVREAYPQLILDPSLFDCPRINIVRLIESTIENLRGFSFHFRNHPILIFREELLLLRDSLKESKMEDNFLSELQNEGKELKDPWTRISNVAHQADRTIKSIMYLKSFLWVDMLCTFDVIKEIKLVLSEVRRIQGQHMDAVDAYRTKRNLSLAVPLKSNNAQIIDEVVVGFEHKVKHVRDWLTSRSEKLNIISIIGMAGLGKTTLAKTLYNDPLIKLHFTMCAWCTVSQSYEHKRLLLDILNDVTGLDVSLFKREKEEELADRLRKCLKGQKYFIVMDDIWDIGAWDAVKLSFPDDNNCSRILFTSRIHDVVLRAKLDSFPYTLSPLSEEESWELLEKRIFHGKDICPRDFVMVGKQIAKDCKGLPLAIVLVAGLLKEKDENLDWWKQIGEKISRNSIEGCAHILELSFKHLPEPLKPCFLYLGLFQEDKEIKVQKLTKLWISEGFIQKHETENVENLAKEYVMDLVGRSMLIVTKRSSSGGIKGCRIHDLLREFCLGKSEEENFFKLLRGYDVSQLSRCTMNQHYRVCIHAEHCSSFFVGNSSPLHSLLISPTHAFESFEMNNSSLRKVRFLQVLDLEDVKIFGDFPEEVTALLLLRYLAIWCTTKVIPPTLVRLKNLETLRVRTENACAFPSEIWQMENLRHVDIRKLVITQGFFDDALPMKNIQSFSFPCLTYGRQTENFLRKIPTIQKLRCQFSSNIEDVQVTKLDFLIHLESLNMTNRGRFLLKSFEIFFLPSTLKKLTLSYFRLPWTELPKIAMLPNLQVLKLLAYAFVGKCWNMEADDEFSKLKFLKLQNMDIEQWTASPENFPSLEQMVVEQCHRLEEIPTTLGEVPCLRMIQVLRCRSSVVNSAIEIQEKQTELGNEDFKLQTMQILKQKFFRLAELKHQMTWHSNRQMFLLESCDSMR